MLGTGVESSPSPVTIWTLTNPGPWDDPAESGTSWPALWVKVACTAIFTNQHGVESSPGLTDQLYGSD